MKSFNKNTVLWAAVFGLFWLFIFALSYWYPLTSDEYVCYPSKISCYMYSYIEVTSRIGALLSVSVLAAGRWLFVALNPFVQLSLVLSIFYFIFVRLPDVKSLVDIPAFVLICILCVFAVPVPDHVLFWSSGAANYSWLALPFFIFLCALRRVWAKGDFLAEKWWVNVLAFFFGVFLGMTNENSAPMALCLAGLFAALCVWRKKKIPAWFYRVCIGMVIGLCLLFGAPVQRFKISGSIIVSEVIHVSIFKKMFFHLYKMNYFFTCNLCIFPLTALGLILLALRRFKTVIKDEDFILSALCLAVSFVLAMVLMIPVFAAPRVFYSAALFSITAFIFLLKYLSKTYKINFMKYVFMLALTAALVITPLFSIPYYSLHKQSKEREKLLAYQLEKGAEEIFLPVYVVTRGPAGNLTMLFFDPIRSSINLEKYYKKQFATNVIYEKGNIHMDVLFAEVF